MTGPKITIVIATLNDGPELGFLLDSISQQTYRNIQVIVQDGNSTDGTLELLQRRNGEIDHWSSEDDSGIYQAWNKALKHATGDFICFLGADDQWADSTSLQQLVQLATEDRDLVCAQYQVMWCGGNNGSPTGTPWHWQALERGMPLSHRGMLHRKSLFEKHGPFDESFRIAGDYEFLLRCGPDLNTAFLGEVTVKAGPDGVSITMPLLSLKERYIAQRRHNSVSFLEAVWLYIKECGLIMLLNGKNYIRHIIKSNTGKDVAGHSGT